MDISKTNLSSATKVQWRTGRKELPDTVDVVLIDGQFFSVPQDPMNRDYKAILEWVAEGNTIEEAD
jgi:hypothetical protein